MDRRPDSFDGHNWIFMAGDPHRPTQRKLMQCTRCGETLWEWEVAMYCERPGRLSACDNFNAGRYGYEPVTRR